MHHLVIVLACLTQGHGRRIQAASKQSSLFEQSLLKTRRSNLFSGFSAGGTGLQPQEADPLKTLAVLLAAESPTAAFGAASVGTGSALTKAACHRACSHFLRAAPCLLQAAVLDENPVVVRTKILTCDTCRASFFLELDSLPEDGQKVHCCVCDEEWLATPAALRDMPSNMEVVDYPEEMKARLEAGESVRDIDIFVAGLAPGTTERALKSHFEKCGPVSNVNIVLDYDGNPRGFGFVTMESWADGQMAIQTLGGTQIMGKTVTVKASKTQRRPSEVTAPAPRTKWTHEGGKALTEFHEGQRVQGKVTNIASSGVYINFGSLKDGLLPPLKMMGPMPKVGDVIKDLEIERIDLAKNWISLRSVPPQAAGAHAEVKQPEAKQPEAKQPEARGKAASAKQPEEEQKEGIPPADLEEGTPLAELRKGQKVEGTVARLSEIGVWIDIGAQTDALVPTPVWTASSHDTPKVGDFFSDLEISSVDVEKQKLTARFPKKKRLQLKLSKDYTVAAARQRMDRTTDKEEIAVGDEEASNEAQQPIGDGKPDFSGFSVGQRVEGKLVKKGKQDLFVDIGASREAVLPTAAYLALDGTEMPKIGDLITDLEIEKIDLDKEQISLIPSDPDADELLGMFDDVGVDDDVGQEQSNSAGLISDLDIDRLGHKGSESDVGTGTASSQDKAQLISPQALAISDLREGQKVEGTVTRIENRGVYINIGAETDGLLPSAACTMKTGLPQVGDVISDLEIGRVDAQGKKFRLKLTDSVADAEAPPQQEKEQAVSPKLLPISDLRKGQKVEGTVTRINNRGIYINVGAETDGLLPSAACTMKTGMPEIGDVVSELEVDRVDKKKGAFRLKLSSLGASTGTAPEQTEDKQISAQVDELVSELGAKLAEQLGSRKDKQELTPQANKGAVEAVAVTKPDTEVELPQASKGAVEAMAVTKPDPEVELTQASQGAVEAVVAAKPDTEVEPPKIQEFWLHPEGKAISEFSEGQYVKGSVTGLTRVGMFIDIGAQKDALLPTAACEEMPRLGALVTDLEIHRVDLVNSQLWLQCSSKSKQERLKISELQEGQTVEGTVIKVDHRGVSVDIGANKDGLLPLEACKITDGLPKTGELIKDLQIQRIDLKREKVTLMYPKQTSSTESVRQEAKAGLDRSEALKVSAAHVGQNVQEEVKKADLEPTKPESPSEDVTPRMKRWINPDGVPVSELQVGKAVEGVVTNVAEIGVFVNIGAERDAVLPSELLRPTEEGQPEIGDFITDLEIEDTDVPKKQIWLRSAQDKSKPDTELRGKKRWFHPRGLTMSQLQVGQQVEGNVTNVAVSGIFINIGAQQDGFIPIGDFTKHREGPRIGDFVEGLEISRVDAQKGRFWMKFANPRTSSRKVSPLVNIKKNQRVSGPVTAITTNGVFVDIGSVKDGLLAASEAKKLTSLPSVGEIMKDLEVERVDLVKEQIWLKSSLELLSIEDLYDGREVQGSVKTINSFGAFINIGAVQEGLLPASQLSGAKLHPGDKLTNLVVHRLGGERFSLSLSDRKLQTS